MNSVNCILIFKYPFLNGKVNGTGHGEKGTGKSKNGMSVTRQKKNTNQSTPINTNQHQSTPINTNQHQSTPINTIPTVPTHR
jgi:hypothetical protein